MPEHERMETPMSERAVISLRRRGLVHLMRNNTHTYCGKPATGVWWSAAKSFDPATDCAACAKAKTSKSEEQAP